MAQLLTIEDNTVVISNLTLSTTQGEISHTGDINLTGSINSATNVSVTGALSAHTLTVDTINVNNLITANGALGNVGSWIYSTEAELNGKGFNWTWGTGQAQLIYRTGNRIWTNASFDVASGSSYNIDNIPVISASALGTTITSSNLTKVGTLNNLTVSGDTTLGDFAHFNSTLNRIGLGTEDPVSAINIIENNVSISIGSPKVGLATFGTNSNHDTAIVTDGLARILVKNTGEVNIGDPVNGGGILNVYGTLNVTNMVSNVESINSIQFAGAGYGLGLVWNNKQLILSNNPDRILSTEHIDIGAEKCYYINGQLALSSTSLGQGIVYSNLVTVGALQSLSVTGATTIAGQLTANTISVVDNITSSSASIQIGDVTNQTKPVRVFGPLSVNINNPDPTLQFSVNGDVSLGNKRFTNSTSVPTTGIFQIGDICWNTAPQAGSYIGWVCVTAGSPGHWIGFGTIAAQ
jgi:hypothetical protein